MSVLIRTRAGTVRGVARDGVRVWKGIPYGAPPVGALRFAPPQPAAAWSGERDATHYGPAAMQVRQALLSGVTDRTTLSEDCLSLNIVAPGEGAERRPVVVFIHGGAFIMGTAATSMYDGSSFARLHGLVVVTLNYRLGLFGLMLVGEAGNVCLLDQVLALRWVADNIAAFGGDPDNVTVMGESAGAFSIAHLLAIPAAHGLFARAILESGAAPIQPTTRLEAEAVTARVTAELGVTTAGLADVPADRLLAIQAALVTERGLAAFGPYIDGATLPADPLATIRGGGGAQVPLLIGSNRDEWALFDAFVPGATDAVIARLRAHDGLALAELPPEYGSWPALIGDLVFRIPAIWLAEATAAPVYMYRFDVASPAFGGRLGAAHAIELPLVWNQLDHVVAKMLLGPDLTSLAPLAAHIHATWAAFIATGEPAGGGLPAWPRYDRPRRATMIIDHASRVEDDPGRAQRERWSPP